MSFYFDYAPAVGRARFFGDGEWVSPEICYSPQWRMYGDQAWCNLRVRTMAADTEIPTETKFDFESVIPHKKDLAWVQHATTLQNPFIICDINDMERVIAKAMGLDINTDQFSDGSWPLVVNSACANALQSMRQCDRIEGSVYYKDRKNILEENNDNPAQLTRYTLWLGGQHFIKTWS